MQVRAWLERAAAVRPHATAVQAADGTLSYAELHERARAGAAALQERGVGAGERVALALPPGAAFAQALHACMLLGAVAVPLDLRLTSSERERTVEGCSLVVERPLAEGATARAPAQGPPAQGPPAQGPPAHELTQPSASALAQPHDWARAPAQTHHDLDAVALVMHTSGTTCAPRPVALTYGNLLWSALGSAVALGLDAEERWLCALPLSHVGGLSILVRSAIYGTTAVVHERFDAERVHDALMTEGVTLVSLVATTLARLLDAGLREPPRLRCALTGGGPVPAALVRRAREAGVPARETYGLTECCSQAATAPPGVNGVNGVNGVDGMGGVDAVGGVDGAGAPLFCTRVRVARDGEILLAGPTVAPGAVAGDGWLHTGDLGRLDERGLLRVTGRRADTIVTGGENVSPAEVEAVLEAHPAVAEAAVVGREHAEWGEAVDAIVVVAPAAVQAAPGGRMEADGEADGDADGACQAPLERQLREHCAAALAPFKVPKRFRLVSGPLPRTRSGKLLRRELR